MAEPCRHHRFTYAEYIAFETVSADKHEFHDGEIFAMAGGSAEHAALAVAAASELRLASRDRGCRVYSSDLRLFVESAGLATYPDATVICGGFEQHEASPESTALNPQILVEVTSNSSEEYDTGAKLEFYRTIPTLREYLIISHRERLITLHARSNDGEWTQRDAGPGGTVDIPSLNATLSVDEIYADSTIA